ncbi:MAG: molybdate ABC transporter substrate-binding protein [Acidimicrobiia bacterium]|nr:molybdate ABC transporter substrate-binding protein [Acidimicrobiia bacterium]
MICRGATSLAVVLAVGCGGGDSADGDPMLVLAAASLTDAFTDIGAAFEEANDGVTVEFSFGGSSSLATQIVEGAPAAVFASASSTQMTVVVDAGLAAEPVVFTNNLLEIAVPPGNPAGIATLEDFAREDLLLGLCAEEVPCGTFAREAFAAAGITPSVDTNEPDVRALLTKVETGELDGGIVYRSDVVASGDAVEGIVIPSERNVVARYPMAVLEEAPDPETAQAFVDFVLSRSGQETLDRYGFTAP